MQNDKSLPETLAEKDECFATLYRGVASMAPTVRVLQQAIEALPIADRPTQVVPVSMGDQMEVTVLDTPVFLGRTQELSLLIWEVEQKRIGVLVHNSCADDGYGFTPWGRRLGGIRIEKVGAIPPIAFPVFPFYEANQCELCSRGIPHVPVPELLRNTIRHTEMCGLTRAQRMEELRKEHRLALIVLGDGAQGLRLPEQRGRTWFFREPGHIESGRGSFLTARAALSPGWWGCRCGCGNSGRIPPELVALARHSHTWG
jgi:hypothetical protein